jgi:hypothetical protein
MIQTATQLVNNRNVNDSLGIFAKRQDDSFRHRHRLRLDDGAEALAWLRGTEVEKQLRGSEDVTKSLLASSSPSDVL